MNILVGSLAFLSALVLTATAVSLFALRRAYALTHELNRRHHESPPAPARGRDGQPARYSRSLDGPGSRTAANPIRSGARPGLPASCLQSHPSLAGVAHAPAWGVGRADRHCALAAAPGSGPAAQGAPHRDQQRVKASPGSLRQLVNVPWNQRRAASWRGRPAAQSALSGKLRQCSLDSTTRHLGASAQSRS